MVSAPARSRVHIDPQWLRGFCERHYVRRLWLYGSALRDSFRADSDVDILIEYDPAHVPSLFTLAGMAAELDEAIGRAAVANLFLRHLRQYDSDRSRRSAAYPCYSWR